MYLSKPSERMQQVKQVKNVQQEIVVTLKGNNCGNEVSLCVEKSIVIAKER